MKEETLRDYFNGAASVAELSEAVGNDTYSDLMNVIQIIELKDGREFPVTIEHIMKLGHDTINENLEYNQLSQISFCLETSDFFVWDTANETGERIASILNEWCSPEIHTPLSKGYLKYCLYFLETGDHR